jgi:Ca-activated chloride channel family protein
MSALCAAATSAAVQFASGVSLVEVYATVLDQGGEPVSGLEARDFTVEENGREQAITAFTAGDVPLSLAIGVDRSFSMSADRLRTVVYGVQTLLGQLQPEDRVMLLAIGSEVEILTPLSNDHRAAYDALKDLAPWGTTPLYDATLAAINAVQNASGRRALILISDLSDRYSESTATNMVEEARRHDVLVYPVSLRRTSPPVFVELASVSGGRSIAVADLRNLNASLSSIATELRRQYLLGYVPSADGAPGWRSITARVNRPGLRVRARDGYYAGR